MNLLGTNGRDRTEGGAKPDDSTSTDMPFGHFPIGMVNYLWHHTYER
jgi:hypothetical protein